LFAHSLEVGRLQGEGAIHIWIQKDGDIIRFVEWWVLVEFSLFRHLTRKGVARDVAEDIVQDVALGLVLRAGGSYDGFLEQQFTSFSHFEASCFKRANWLLVDRIRIERRVRQVPDMVSGVPPSQEKQTLIGEILRLVSELPPHQRFVMEGQLEGRSAKEIADRMQAAGITAEGKIEESTVRSLQRFARHKLVEQLGGGS
jgi:DNA-directed RNA polymerase specialized sigma24 family protein